MTGFEMRRVKILSATAVAAGLLMFSMPSIPELTAETLPAPIHKRIVLHGVSVDARQGTVDAESLPVLDEAATLLGQGEASVVVEAADVSRRQSDLAQSCPQDVVRTYLQSHGVPENRVIELAWLSADPTDSASSRCRVGLLNR